MNNTNYPDGRYKMTNPHDTTGDGWTIEQIIDGRLRGSMTPVEDWTAIGYTFEPVVIMTVVEYEKAINALQNRIDESEDERYDPGEAAMNDYE